MFPLRTQLNPSVTNVIVSDFTLPGVNDSLVLNDLWGAIDGVKDSSKEEEQDKLEQTWQHWRRFLMMIILRKRQEQRCSERPLNASCLDGNLLLPMPEMED